MCQTSVFNVQQMARFDWPSAGHQFSHKIDVRNKDSDVWNRDKMPVLIQDIDL